MAVGKKILQRLRWLYLAMQFGGLSTRRHGIMLANRMLVIEDMYSESDADSSSYEHEPASEPSGEGNDDCLKPQCMTGPMHCP